MKCEIKHSKRGEYYEMFINGEFYGNYDTVDEAARDLDQIVLEKAEEVAS